MPREPSHGRGASCPACRAKVWRARWNGLTIYLDHELALDIPPAGRGVGAMVYRGDEWTGAKRTDSLASYEVRLVHNCPGTQPGNPPTTVGGQPRPARPALSESESEATTMTDPWDSPGSTAGVDFEELNGRLLVITPHAAEEVNTSFGEKECVRADLVVLDGPSASTEYKDTLIFPKVLIGQLRSTIGTGRMVLGRLGQGVAKPGQKPPWLLADPTEADRKVAGKWYETRQAKSLPF